MGFAILQNADIAEAVDIGCCQRTEWTGARSERAALFSGGVGAIIFFYRASVG